MRKEPPPTSFSPVTSTIVGMDLQNFRSFNPIFHTGVKLQSHTYCLPQFIEPPSKNWFFSSNPYKIEAMVTSLIETLELPNFGNMTTSAT